MPMLRHVGIPVVNLDRSRDFYERLGFRMESWAREKWRRELQVMKLRTRDDSTCLELIEGVWQPHIAIEVESIDPWRNLVEFCKEPAYYVRDPDGNYLELVEVRK